MEEKNKLVSEYITQISEQINKQYSGLMNEERITRAIEMFKDSSEEYYVIVKRINELAQQVIQNFLAEQEKRFNPELVKQNHDEIYSKLEVLVKKLNERGIDYQLAGALCSYIKYGQESQRTHDDIDINLNEEDIDKFREVCEEMGLSFNDNRLTPPRVLKNGIPSGEHEVIATLDNSDFHIGAFCFERKPDGIIINKGYYHDENGQVFSRDDIISPELAREIFGKEVVDFRGQKLVITPPEYIYKLKNYTKNNKDKFDIEFMQDKIDRAKLERISSLSSTSRTEHTLVSRGITNTNSSKKYNYHTHTYRSGHGEYCSDSDIVKTAKTNGITSLGFSEHIPNPDLMLPDEDNRMLLSEVDGYISSISKLRQDNPDMTILVGFEAEYDPMKESFLGEMREKVDYMILGQHFLSRGLSQIPSKGNPNYPIEYANMVVKAIESGIFDIVAHPDIFMEFRDTMPDEQSKQLFEENSIIASQIICEKARDMGMPIEINLGGVNKYQILSDGNLTYPHPTFWKVASEIEGLQVIQGIDAHNLGAIENANKYASLVSSITDMVADKMVAESYNPVVARQNNKKLQEAYKKGQDKALSFETQMVNQMLAGINSQIPENIDTYDTTLYIEQGFDAMMQSCITNATQKDKAVVDELSTIPENADMSITDKKGKIERKKKAIEETNQVLANQQRTIETAKTTVRTAINMGCERKEEIANISTQITEHNCTNNESKKGKIEQNISNFQQSKGMPSGLSETKGQAYQLKRTNNNNNNNSNNGFINVVTLSLIVTFVVGIAVGIGYMLYKISIGG